MFLMVLATGTSGCFYTTVEPARQLHAGDVVSGGSVATSGAIIPEFNGMIRRGFGWGDIGANAGTTTGVFFTLGGSGRLYLSELFTLSMQLQAAASPISFDPFFGYFAATPRLTTSTSADRSFYGGLQGRYVRMHMGGGHDHVIFTGAILGKEFPMRHGVIQVELLLVPYAHRIPAQSTSVFDGGLYVGDLFKEGPGSLLYSQLSLSAYTLGDSSPDE